MAMAALSAIRFWAYPAMVIALWVVVSAFSLTQLNTELQNGNKRAFQYGLEGEAGARSRSAFSL